MLDGDGRGVASGRSQGPFGEPGRGPEDAPRHRPALQGRGMNFLRKLFPSCGEKSKDVMRRLDRRWQYSPDTHWWRGGLNIGINLDLIQYEGKPHEPRPVQTFLFRIVFLPWKWKI